MDGQGVERFRWSGKSSIVIIGLFGLLLASLIWNVYQYKRLEYHELRIRAEARAAGAHAEVNARQARERRGKQAESKAADLRVQQLYREIDTLSRMNEQLLEQPLYQHRSSRHAETSDAGDGTP